MAPARRRHGARRVAALVAACAAVAGCVALAAELGLVAVYDVSSASMEPTLHCAAGPGCAALEDDVVLVVRYAGFGVRRGEIVVFTPPRGCACDGRRRLIKRVIGLPGETVAADRGRIVVDGVRYGKRAVDRDFPPQRVPRDSYFVLGDNGRLSFDSRTFGPIPRTHIAGRAVAVVWPFSRLRGR